MSGKVKISDINPHIICVLCSGYFIDPVTITECLHSFCKTCIITFIESEKKCPICDLHIHKTRPLLNIRSDKTLQDIVYKLVPGLHEDEMNRRKKFFKSNPPEEEQLRNFKQERDKIFFSEDDKMSLSIEYFEPGLKKEEKKQPSIKNENRRYLQCPGMVKIKHLKNFVSNKYGLIDNFMVDIIYNEELIPEEYTLIDVAYLYNWRKDKPMQFYYRVFKKNTVLLRKRKIDAIVTNGSAYVKKSSSSLVNPGSPVKKESVQPLAERKKSSPPSSKAPVSPGKHVKSQSHQSLAPKPQPKPLVMSPKPQPKKPEAKVSESSEIIELSINVSASDVKQVVSELNSKEKEDAGKAANKDKDLKVTAIPIGGPTPPKMAKTSSNGSAGGNTSNILTIVHNLAKKKLDAHAGVDSSVKMPNSGVFTTKSVPAVSKVPSSPINVISSQSMANSVMKNTVHVPRSSPIVTLGAAKSTASSRPGLTSSPQLTVTSSHNQMKLIKPPLSTSVVQSIGNKTSSLSSDFKKNMGDRSLMKISSMSDVLTKQSRVSGSPVAGHLKPQSRGFVSCDPLKKPPVTTMQSIASSHSQMVTSLKNPSFISLPSTPVQSSISTLASVRGTPQPILPKPPSATTSMSQLQRPGLTVNTSAGYHMLKLPVTSTAKPPATSASTAALLNRIQFKGQSAATSTLPVAPATGNGVNQMKNLTASSMLGHNFKAQAAFLQQAAVAAAQQQQMQQQKSQQQAQQQQHSIVKQSSINELLNWRKNANGSSNDLSRPKPSMAKSLNQSIRQIPNPSLLTKPKTTDASNSGK